MKNLFRKLIPTGIAIAGLALASCQPFHYTNKSPVTTCPPLDRVYEGEEYHYQIRAYDPEGNNLEYFLKTTPLINQFPKWLVPLSVNSSGLVTGRAPNVDKDTDYAVEIDISDGENITEQDFTLKVLHVRRP